VSEYDWAEGYAENHPVNTLKDVNCVDPFHEFLSMQNKILALLKCSKLESLNDFLMVNSWKFLNGHSFRPVLNKPFKYFKMGYLKRSFKYLQVFDDTGKMISFVDPEKPEKSKKSKKAKKKS